MISSIQITTTSNVQQVNAWAIFLLQDAVDVVLDGSSGLDRGGAGNVASMSQVGARRAQPGIGS